MTREWRTAWGLALLAVLPVAVAPVPLMADLPNHVARHHILSTALFGTGSGGGSPYWHVAWRWIGNLGVDLPAVLLTPWLGAEAATRLVVAGIAPLTVLGLFALGRAAHGPSRPGWITPGVALALPFAFSQQWHYGFLNSCLSVAVALFAAAAWLQRPVDGARRALLFALAALGVWTTHVMGWGVLLLLVAGAELARFGELRARPVRLLRTLPLFAPLIPLALWRGEDTVGGGGRLFAIGSHPVAEKVSYVATMLRGIDKPFDLGMLAGLALAGAVAVWLARPPRVEPRLAVGAVLLGGAFMAVPGTVLGSWGADLRLAPVAAMIALVAIGPTRRPGVGRALIALGFALFAARTVATTWVWHRAQGELASRLALLDRVPRGSRLAFLEAAITCHPAWPHDVDDKLASLAVVRRDAFVNTLFKIPGADLVSRARPADAGWFDRSQVLQCGDTELVFRQRLNAFAAARFATIWVADRAVGVPPPGYRVVYRAGRDTILAASRLE